MSQVTLSGTIQAGPVVAGFQHSPPLRTFVEYFAGIGFVRAALEPLGWGVVLANDVNPKKQEMYADSFGDVGADAYRLADIRSLNPEDIPSSTLATASFPCIDLSLAGSQSGLRGTHSSTFWSLMKLLKGMETRRPPILLLENVLGWLSSNSGNDFIQSIRALNKLGYVCDAFILNARHFIPQSRPRLFVVGAVCPPKDSRGYHHLTARHPALRSGRLVQTILAHSDLQWMVLDLPSPPPVRRDLAGVLERLLPDASSWWSDEDVNHLLSQMSRDHRARVKLMERADDVCFATVYKRVRAEGTRAEVRVDGMAGCLRTPVGGSSKQIVIQAGRGGLGARWMTAREYARLQGAPDKLPINVPYLQALYGFGDAVCIPAVDWIGRHALEPLIEGL